MEMAIVTPSRRTTPLRYAVALAGSSTAFTNSRRSSAAAATARFTSGVAAATTSHAPSRSVASKDRWRRATLSGSTARGAGDAGPTFGGCPGAGGPRSAGDVEEERQELGHRLLIARLKAFALQNAQKKAREAEPPGPWVCAVAELDHGAISDMQVCRPLAQGLEGSPQQQQQLHMQVG